MLNRPVEQACLTLEQAVERLRGRVVSELRLLNEHLPRSRRLERGEIDCLVDDLLFAVRETPKRRNASLLEKTILMASGVLVHRTRRRDKRRIGGPLSR